MNRINLIPPEFSTGKKALVETGLLMQAVLGGFVLAGTMILLFLISWMGLLGTQHEVTKMKKIYAQKNSIYAALSHSKETLNDQLNHVNERAKELEAKKGKLSFLEDRGDPWSQLLSEFNSAIPVNVWADKLVLEQPVSQVIGGAFTNQNITKFIDRLNESRHFSRTAFIKTESGTVNEKKVVLFELSFELNRG